MEAQVQTAPDNVPFQLFHITCRSLGGVQIRARLARPIDAGNPKRRYPAIVCSPGYSGVAFGESLSDCQRDYIILQVYPRMQGESAPFMSRYAKLGGNWLLYGTEDPQQYYYRGAFADLARGIDYLLTREDVDGRRIGAMASSQGGFLSLGIAGIDRPVPTVVAHVPFLCNLRHNPCFDLAATLGDDSSSEFFAMGWNWMRTYLKDF